MRGSGVQRAQRSRRIVLHAHPALVVVARVAALPVVELRLPVQRFEQVVAVFPARSFLQQVEALCPAIGKKREIAAFDRSRASLHDLGRREGLAGVGLVGAWLGEQAHLGAADAQRVAGAAPGRLKLGAAEEGAVVGAAGAAHRGPHDGLLIGVEQQQMNAAGFRAAGKSRSRQAGQSADRAKNERQKLLHEGDFQ